MFLPTYDSRPTTHVFEMTELQSILASLDSPSVLATVVNVEGSAYRQPGARMLVRRDGSTVGTISGGCLEADIIERAWELTAEPGVAFVRYDSRDPNAASAGLLDDWGFGMGCDGAVDVLLERIDPLHPPDYLIALRDALENRRPVVLATLFARLGKVPIEIGHRTVVDPATHAAEEGSMLDFARQTLAAGRSAVSTVDFAEGSVRVFFEIVQPPPHLLVLGAGHDALPLVRLAAEVGWTISVCDRRSAMATPERFPNASVHAVAAEESLSVLSHPPDAAVIMTHRYPEDVKLLKLLADSAVRYIGVLGPRHRTERLLKATELTLTPDLASRLHAPIGLDLGADTPQQIALAILSEATAAMNGHAGGKLRDKKGRIHEGVCPNSKFEARNSSEIPMTNDQSSKQIL
jgi:xanthine/CO dehydrogenase XdhC/CoxF family maturation factor